MKRKVYLIAFLLLTFRSVGLGRQPELVVQTGHTGVVTQLAFSPTGALLASADSSGTIKLWDLTTSKLLRTISLPFNFDGTMLAGTTAAKRISFRVTASDSLHALDRLNVNVNDVPLFGSGGISLRGRNLKQHEQDITVELASGRNRVQVSATNVAGVESLRQSFEIHCEAPARPALYVVAVGVSTYADAGHNLKFAAKDAADISAAFAGPQKGFDRVYVKQLLDREATRANILNVRTLLTQAGVDDTVILFLAGHGILDQNLDYYFATTDIDFNNPRRNGLSYDDLEGILDGLKARRKVLLLDTCHSGELNRESLLTPSPAGGRGVVVRAVTQRRDAFRDVGLTDSFDLLQEYFAELRRGSGGLVIAASSGAS